MSLRPTRSTRPDTLFPSPTLVRSRDAHSPFVARARRDAARAEVEAMFGRLGADDRTDEGDPAITAARADVEAIIARQGFIVADQPELKSLYFKIGRAHV